MEQKPQSGSGASAPARVRFGAFELDLRAGELRKNGHKIRLQEQPFQILLELLEHPGEVVSREELRRKLWPNGTVVEFDHGINAAVKRLRDSLQDSAETPRYIETLARRGYRFIASVSSEPEKASQLEAPVPAFAAPPLAPEPQLHTGGPARSRSRRRRIAALSAIAAGLAVLFTAVLLRKTGTVSPPNPHFAPLTSNTGLELHPSFSPDGTRVAYTWSLLPQQQPAIYVKLVGPGDAVKVSRDLPRVFSPAWSPDGRWIAAL